MRNKIVILLSSKTDSAIFLCDRMRTERLALISRELYFQSGVLARAISKAETKEELKHVHDLSCGDTDISLYRRL